MRRRLLAYAALVAALAVTAAPASASSNLRVGITDDAWLEFGPGEVDDRAARLRSLGVEISRVTLDWRSIQPSRDTYEWTRTDALLDALRTAGIQPVVALWGTPAWANGGGGPNVAPRSAASFATFARAAAQQYPWVKRWIVWNEPNQRRWLNPPSPITYVTKLLNPAAAAIKSVVPARGDRRRRHGSPGEPWRHVARRLHPRDGARRGAARCVRTSSAPALAGRDALDRRLCAMLDDHDGDARAAARRDAQGLRCEDACLAHRARLPDEPARPHPRRHLVAAGALGRRGAPPRLRGEPRRSSDPVSRARRAAYRGVAERPGDDDESREAGAHGLHAARSSRSRGPGSRPRCGVRCAPGKGARRYVVQRRVGVVWRPVGGAGTTTSRGYFTRTVSATAGTRLRLYDPATRLSSPALVVR